MILVLEKIKQILKNNDIFDNVITIVVTLLIVVILTTILRKALGVFIKKNSSILGVQPTTFVFLKNSVSFILWGVGFMWIFHKTPYFKSLGSVFVAGAGVFAAIIGFASQKAFSNIISGIFILIFKPFRIGDVIEISNAKFGVVESITLRHTVIRDYEFRRVIIPNSIISEETIVNSSFSDLKIRKQINIGIAYNADFDLASKIVIEHIRKHRFYFDNRTEEELLNNFPEVQIRMTKWGDYSVNLRAYVWAENNDKAFELTCDVLHSIKRDFDKQGIEIPFPYQNIIVKDHSKKV